MSTQTFINPLYQHYLYLDVERRANDAVENTAVFIDTHLNPHPDGNVNFLRQVVATEEIEVITNKSIGEIVTTPTSASSATPISAKAIAPVLTAITAKAGTYKIGDNVEATLKDNKAVTVGTTHGLPSLTLNKGLLTSYTPGSSQQNLIASYLVKNGDTISTDLNLNTINLIYSTIRENTGKDAAMALSSSAEAWVNGALTSADMVAPVLTLVSIVSNNVNPSLAKVGDTVILSFTANEPLLSNPTVTIGGKTTTVIHTSGNDYTATYRLQQSDLEGQLNFNIAFSDVAGNAGVNVLTTTNLSSVIFEKTMPDTVIMAADNTTSSALTLTRESDTTALEFPSSEILRAAPIPDVTLVKQMVNVIAINDEVETYPRQTSHIEHTLAFNAMFTDETDNSKARPDEEMAPTLNAVSISSDNKYSSSLAKEGDTVTLSFTADKTLKANPTVTVGGKVAEVTNVGDNDYTATYTLLSTDIEGILEFNISFADTISNQSINVSFVTDSSSVSFDNTPPSITITDISLLDETESFDAITHGTHQTITATLSAKLLTHDLLYGSVNNGASWKEITAQVNETSVIWENVSLLERSQIKFKIIDAAGNEGLEASQSYQLDTSTPTATVISNNLAISATTIPPVKNEVSQDLSLAITIDATILTETAISQDDNLAVDADDSATPTDDIVATELVVENMNNTDNADEITTEAKNKEIVLDTDMSLNLDEDIILEDESNDIIVIHATPAIIINLANAEESLPINLEDDLADDTSLQDVASDHDTVLPISAEPEIDNTISSSNQADNNIWINVENITSKTTLADKNKWVVGDYDSNKMAQRVKNDALVTLNEYTQEGYQDDHATLLTTEDDNWQDNQGSENDTPLIQLAEKESLFEFNLLESSSASTRFANNNTLSEKKASISSSTMDDFLGVNKLIVMGVIGELAGLFEPILI